MKTTVDIEKKYEAKVKLLESNFADMLMGQKWRLGRLTLSQRFVQKSLRENLGR